MANITLYVLNNTRVFHEEVQNLKIFFTFDYTQKCFIILIDVLINLNILYLWSFLRNQVLCNNFSDFNMGLCPPLYTFYYGACCNHESAAEA